MSRTIAVSAVALFVALGALVHFVYDEARLWFEPAPHMPSSGDLVVVAAVGLIVIGMTLAICVAIVYGAYQHYKEYQKYEWRRPADSERTAAVQSSRLPAPSPRDRGQHRDD